MYRVLECLVAVGGDSKSLPFPHALATSALQHCGNYDKREGGLANPIIPNNKKFQIQKRGLAVDQNTVLSVTQLDKRIGKHTILKDISFELQQGEIVGLLGPNGSGKTTLMKCVVGLLKATKGHIEVNGYDLHKKFEQAMAHIGAIIENPEFYEYMTGYDNLLHYKRMNEDVSEERLDEVIDLLEMEDYIEDKVSTYSLGMKQRLGLGQAILHRPSILLLDEPTNGLDPSGIKDLRNHLKHLARHDGVSVVISSHVLAEIELICDRVIVIHDGALVESGRLDDFRTDTAEGDVVTFRLSSLDRAEQIVKNQSEWGTLLELTSDGLSVRANYQGVAELNRRFVQEDIHVYAIEWTKVSLEDAFFKKLRGKQP
ncbi:ABC transporter ATP-binding protein [Bacillus horti]|uniref:ABC-2 type transport system ATP-binding protein n=1 Tax=Caldalkalibacillus horti TaxID=77523 RepID=A0ABT9W4S3_9BACI|nr:ABC transporter ATP-binding protein [Bacillus horti]MDQ0168235.1 ABC-2 type transport system ATP-binding protein [Bacillus horti]